MGEKKDWGPWKAVLGSRAIQGGTREVKKMCSENGLTSPGLLQNDLPCLTLDATRGDLYKDYGTAQGQEDFSNMW